MASNHDLGTSISLNEVKSKVRERNAIEFTATAVQVNLEDFELQQYLNRVRTISLPPLGNKKELFRIFYQMDAQTDSLKWDYITLLTYLNGGEIFYELIDDKKILVSITF